MENGSGNRTASILKRRRMPRLVVRRSMIIGHRLGSPKEMVWIHPEIFLGEQWKQMVQQI